MLLPLPVTIATAPSSSSNYKHWSGKLDISHVGKACVRPVTATETDKPSFLFFQGKEAEEWQSWMSPEIYLSHCIILDIGH